MVVAIDDERAHGTSRYFSDTQRLNDIFVIRKSLEFSGEVNGHGHGQAN